MMLSEEELRTILKIHNSRFDVHCLKQHHTTLKGLSNVKNQTNDYTLTHDVILTPFIELANRQLDNGQRERHLHYTPTAIHLSLPRKEQRRITVSSQGDFKEAVLRRLTQLGYPLVDIEIVDVQPSKNRYAVVSKKSPYYQQGSSVPMIILKSNDPFLDIPYMTGFYLDNQLNLDLQLTSNEIGYVSYGFFVLPNITTSIEYKALDDLYIKPVSVTKDGDHYIADLANLQLDSILIKKDSVFTLQLEGEQLTFVQDGETQTFQKPEGLVGLAVYTQTHSKETLLLQVIGV